MAISYLHYDACYLKVYRDIYTHTHTHTYIYIYICVCSVCVYIVTIWYIADNLDPTSYLLNFGVGAINEIHPKVIVRCTLKNIRNYLSKGWTKTIEGEILEDLSNSVYAVVAPQKKTDVW